MLVMKEPGSGSVLTSKARSGSVLRPIRTRNTGVVTVPVTHSIIFFCFKNAVQARATVLQRLAAGGREGDVDALLEGIDPSLLTVARGLAGIHGFKKKKKKRGPNKWMPFR